MNWRKCKRKKTKRELTNVKKLQKRRKENELEKRDPANKWFCGQLGSPTVMTPDSGPNYITGVPKKPPPIYIPHRNAIFQWIELSILNDGQGRKFLWEKFLILLEDFLCSPVIRIGTDEQDLPPLYLGEARSAKSLNFRFHGVSYRMLQFLYPTKSVMRHNITVSWDFPGNF